MSKSFHMGLDVEGALRNGAYKRDMVGSCRDDSGRVLNADEIFDQLVQAIREGKRVLPYGDCDNFDYQRGCLGHEKAKEASDQ